MNIGRDTLRRLGILVVILHALITTPHSIAHTHLFIAMDVWQNIYIFVVILIAPILAAILIWKRRPSGFVILTISMVGSFVFGAYYHFVAIGSDSVFTLPANPWTTTFQLTALLLVLSELAGVVVGFLGIRLETIQP
jgi:hypothetical protein